MRLRTYGKHEGEFEAVKTPQEAREILRRDGEVWWHSLGDPGRAVRVKVNGTERRWKRSPERFRFPIKYGLYEYGEVTETRNWERVLRRTDQKGG